MFAGATPAPKMGRVRIADPHGVWKKKVAFVDAAPRNELYHQKARNTLIYAQTFALHQAQVALLQAQARDLSSRNPFGGGGGIYARRV